MDPEGRTGHPPPPLKITSSLKYLYRSDPPREAIGVQLLLVGGLYGLCDDTYRKKKPFSVPPEEYFGSMHGREYENLSTLYSSTQ